MTIHRFLPIAACCLLSPAAALAAPFAYMANVLGANVSVIDMATDTVAATIPVGNQPFGAAVNPLGTRAYVANALDNSLSVLDTTNNAVLATLPVGAAPRGVAVLPSGTRIYVANSGSNSVSVLDALTQAPVATIAAVGVAPFGVAADPAGTRVYVTNQFSDTVTIIDAATNVILGSVAVGAGPRGIAVTPSGARLYVVNQFDNSVSVIDTATNTVVATIPVGAQPVAVAVDAAGTRAYVSNFTDGTLSVIDTASNLVTAIMPVGGTSPGGLAVNAAGSRVYVAGYNTNTVRVLDTASGAPTAVIPVGTTPYGDGRFIGPATISATSHSGASATGSGTVTAGFAGGGGACAYVVARFVTPAAVAAPPSAVTFPHGLFDFSANGCAAGSTLSFTVTYPSALPAGTQYWKYGPTAANPAPHWYVLPATVAGNTVTFSVTDGGLGDDDLAANGVIVDQGGPGIPPSGIPSLSQWGLLLLSSLLAGLAALRLRRTG